MASVSGLTATHRIQARDRIVAAAMLALRNRDKINYTQGAARWEGINKKLNARLGQYPRNADCSAFATWCIWNGLMLGFGVRDTVNGADWKAGYTGTMMSHGKKVAHEANVQRGDCAIYGHGAPGEHTAIVVGRRADGTIMVVSHGSQAGPFYLPAHYRSDLMGFWRYV
jgi:hypothetical protein